MDRVTPRVSREGPISEDFGGSVLMADEGGGNHRPGGHRPPELDVSPPPISETFEFKCAVAWVIGDGSTVECPLVV